MHKNCVTDLLLLLKAEQALIITGQYAGLDELMPRKLSLFEKIHREKVDEQDLYRIKDILTQNKRLLAAALNGIRTARDRLETLNKVRNGLQVYDHTGHLKAAILQRPDIVRKA